MAKRAKELKKKQHKIVVKEIKFRLGIGEHDFNTKIRHAQEFLSKGNRVKITVQFHGRQITHPELGKILIENVITSLADTARIETPVKSEGKLLITILSPKRKN